MTERLRIALQKKGRLADDSFALLKKCGLRFAIRGGGLLARVKNMPIDLLLVRDDDIPSFVANNAADIGIVGENVLVEEQLTLKQYWTQRLLCVWAFRGASYLSRHLIRAI